MSEINDLASGIFATEFDSDSNNVNPAYVSGWLSSNLGLLNTLLNTSFSGENPNLGLEEKSIYTELYLHNYYNKQARNVLRGITSSSSSSDNITMVADGDNKIMFGNKNEVAKTYKDLAKASKEKLDNLITKYNIYGSKPLQVVGYESRGIPVPVDETITAYGNDGTSSIFTDQNVQNFLNDLSNNNGIIDAGAE
jgi:hypothetical protein